MKILVVNSGSSSLKFQLIDMGLSAVLAKGVIDRIGIDGSCVDASFRDGVKRKSLLPIENHIIAVKVLLERLLDPDNGVLSSIEDIGAVGHRIVHNGGIFHESTLVTDATLKEMEQTFDLAPLHNPASIKGILACRETMKDTPMVMVFDTEFHETVPPKAYMYGIDYEDYKAYKVRKYGFHGISHRYVTEVAARELGTPNDKLKIITCHLGNGASVSAVDGGKCVDTSMGFTPLEGLIMGTRSGDIDPTVLEYLCKKKGWTQSEGLTYANKACGVKGICGKSDFRDIVKQANEGDEKSK